MFNWFLILAAYLPFQIALNIFPGVDLASSRLFIIILFFAWFVYLLFHKDLFKKEDFLNIQSICLILFLILSCFSLIKAENIFWGLRKIIYFLSIIPLYYLTVSLADDWSKIRKLVKVLSISSILIALIGFIQFLAQFFFGLNQVFDFWAANIVPVFSGFNYGALILAYPSWLVNLNGKTIMRAFSLFSDPHIFPFYLGLIIPLLIVLTIKNRLISRFFLYFFLLLVLLLSFSRGAYLAIIFTFLILSFLAFRYLKDKKTALLLVILLIIMFFPKSPFLNRLYSSFDLEEGSNMGRLDMWQKANQIGWQNPWAGIGLGNYSLSVDSAADYRNPITAHNFYLDIFSEMGLFAIIVWLLLILVTISQLFQKMKKVDKEKKYLFIGLIGSLSYFSIHSFFETAIYQPVILAVLMIILALAVIVNRNVKENY